jgi:hypothetical protein
LENLLHYRLSLRLGAACGPSVARHHQSRPNPRGSSTAQISSRSRSTSACRLLAGGALAQGLGQSVEPSRILGPQRDQLCDRRVPSPHSVESSGRSQLPRRHRAAFGLTLAMARLALGTGQGALAPGRATSTLGFRHVTIFQGDHAACLSVSFLCSARAGISSNRTAPPGWRSPAKSRYLRPAHDSNSFGGCRPACAKIQFL